MPAHARVDGYDAAEAFGVGVDLVSEDAERRVARRGFAEIEAPAA